MEKEKNEIVTDLFRTTDILLGKVNRTGSIAGVDSEEAAYALGG